MMETKEFRKEDYKLVRVLDKLNPVENKPIALLLIHTQTFETYIDKTLIEAHISINYKNLIENEHSRNFELQGGFKRNYFNHTDDGKFSISSKNIRSGDIIITRNKGNRIGTYFICSVIKWLQSYGKDTENALLNSLNLVKKDGEDHNNKLRRKKLYTNIGIPLIFNDDNEMSGYSGKVKLKDLKQVESWKINIQELDIEDYYLDLYLENKKLLRENSSLQESINNLNTKKQAFHSSPLLIGIKTFFRFYPHKLLVPILSITFIYIILCSSYSQFFKLPF